eukprot:CAMPEP_0197644424 /NCGR_PEP_ID=MMETSP1338-20131121/17405_1 /TAXON_ID=43686 ORGANISM="Pelagodinium beii, Strain RCC1491" /NCGR_SAMPLE_ID=MMETSP1338 /ASSEMBLY_ACC=CAM_ASM_000754 /LENGTH=202 /DNA_ID=CAMNT_0043217817 /DNA_START=106 /DNA_END=714 /DNA_ORIENTATION=-
MVDGARPLYEVQDLKVEKTLPPPDGDSPDQKDQDDPWWQKVQGAMAKLFQGGGDKAGNAMELRNDIEAEKPKIEKKQEAEVALEKEVEQAVENKNGQEATAAAAEAEHLKEEMGVRVGELAEAEAALKKADDELVAAAASADPHKDEAGAPHPQEDTPHAPAEPLPAETESAEPLPAETEPPSDPAAAAASADPHEHEKSMD